MTTRRRPKYTREEQARLDAEVPERWWEKTLDVGTFEEPVDEQALEVVCSYEDKMPRRLEAGRGLVLMGAPGVGKTHMAMALAQTAIDNDFTTLVLTARSYVDRLYERIELSQAWQKYEDEVAFRNWKELDAMLTALTRPSAFDLLVLDDLGAERYTRSGFGADELTLFIRERGEAKGATIITTNHSMDEIEAKYGERLSSWLQEVCEIVPVTGEDARARR